MIQLICGIKKQSQPSKPNYNVNRPIDVENKLLVAKGEGAGDRDEKKPDQNKTKMAMQK